MPFSYQVRLLKFHEYYDVTKFDIFLCLERKKEIGQGKWNTISVVIPKKVLRHKKMLVRTRAFLLSTCR